MHGDRLLLLRPAQDIAIAQTCAADDPAKLAALYRGEDLEVPQHLL